MTSNSLSELAARKAVEHLFVKSEAIEAARATSGPDRMMAVRIARAANHAAIHALRSHRQAVAHDLPSYIGVPYQPRKAVRARVLAQARRDLGPPANRELAQARGYWMAGAAAWIMAMLMFIFAVTARAEAGTLDLEVSVGANVSEYLSGAGRFNKGVSYDGGFAGPRDTIEFALVWRSNSGRWFCKLSHISHLSAGPPFNRRPEDFLERLEFGYRWRLGGAQ